MELRNRITTFDGAEVLALDWGTLGRLVRKRAIEAVAMHFALIGSTGSPDASNRGSVVGPSQGKR